jgi:hypothetical protein
MMTDDRGEIRHINWGELFSFTHIFKGFKLAIHPSKLVLAVAAIVLIWAAGGAMDLIWCWTSHDIRPGEVQDYVSSPDTYKIAQEQWDSGRLAKARERLQRVQGGNSKFDFSDILLRPGSSTSSAFLEAFNTAFDEWVKAHPDRLPHLENQASADVKNPDKLSEIVAKIHKGQAAQAEAVLAAIDGARAAREKDPEVKDKADAQKQLKDDYVAARSNFTLWKRDNRDAMSQIQGVCLFDSFASFEWNSISNAIAAVGNGNILGGWLSYQPSSEPTITPYSGGMVQSGGPGSISATAVAPGFVYYMLQAVGGLKWLLTQHLLFGILLLVVSLAVWALFGGAIHRMTALHSAREEKISIVQALKFALGKWPSFFTAPLIPLAVVFVLGGIILVGSLVANIPYAGAPLVGFLFFLALGLGLAIAFVLVGLISGLGLMYPTIAVEGSDSFDAFSRSFAYVYARPWHAGLYALVALVYGVVCYLFVRFFAFLALTATYLFMRWGVWTGGEALGQSDKIPVIWKKPTWDSLYGNFHWDAMSGSETVAAVFIWVWVALVAAVVGAFLVSYLSSSATIIYFLLRRKVDATDLDDVYVQESPETPAETPGPVAQTSSAPTAEPAAPPPQAYPAGDAPPAANP